MTQSVLSVRLDSDVKKRFDAFCEDVGMNASVAVNLFVRNVIGQGKIPFEIAQTEGAGGSRSAQARMDGYQRFIQFRKPLPDDFDYKRALSDALEEKHGRAH
jgi:DNA-damage-inducible protein J